MTKLERRIMDFLINNRVFIFFCVSTILNLCIRFGYRNFVSGDAKVFLLPWYESIDTKGINSLSSQIGDYNILYQCIIYVFTLFPIRPLYAYKIFSVIFDYALAIIVSLIAVEEKKPRNILSSWRFVIVYSVVLLSPVVFLNSSCWAQCDSVYSFFVFTALYAYIKERYAIMSVAYGIAFSFKLQAVFALPFLLILYASEKKFSILYFLIIPLMLILLSLPGIITGRSVLEPFTIYMEQIGEYEKISLNYSSFWNLIGGWHGVNYDYAEFKMIAFFVAVTILGIIFMHIINSRNTLDIFRLIFLLHISVYSSVLFMPSMHERYGFIYEITAILLIFFDERFFFYGIGIILISCMTYGQYLFGLEYSSTIMSFANVALYCGYLYQFINRFGNVSEKQSL